MKFKFLFLLILLFVSFRALAQERDDYVNSVAPVGHSWRIMKTAGFWISRHPSPDTLIMGPEKIDQFNDRLQQEGWTKDIFTILQNFKTDSLLSDFNNDLSSITEKGFYTAGGIRDDQDFIDAAKRNMNLSGVVLGIAPRYGLVVHYTSQRLLPTQEGLYEEKDDFDFDQLQNSFLDVGTPVAVVHVSADGLWYYVMTAISDGWVQIKDIALGDVNQVRAFAEDKDFIAVIKPKADIFLNEGMTDYYDYVRMGMRLPLSGIDSGKATVNVPVMDAEGKLAIRQAYMNEEDVHAGYLPYTARTIYKQALSMLNQPYGWGDIYGEQDCSRFLQMVFATVGIMLPRNSDLQAQVSNIPSDFDEKSDDDLKISALSRAPAGGTLLPMKGHIMLYLGMVNGRPYAIHDTSGYKEMVNGKEIDHVLNRVVVSDLSLGKTGPKGSLLKRLSGTVILE